MDNYTPSPTVTPSAESSNSAAIKTSSAALKKALKNRNGDKLEIVEILIGHTNLQRQQIKSQYVRDYNRELSEDIRKELRGNFQELILALITPPVEYVCRHLNKALSGLTTHEKTLVELLVPRSNKELREIQTLYEKMYERPLVEHICSCTSGQFRRFLALIMTGEHEESSETNKERARLLAAELYAAGEGRRGKDTNVFNRILAKESFVQLRLVFDEYEEISGGNTIEEAVANEMTGDIYEGIIAIIECVRYMPGFFAGCLFRAMKGWGTDDAALIRIIVSRAEIDLENIKESFENIYNRELVNEIKAATSSDFRRGLLMLLGD